MALSEMIEEGITVFLVAALISFNLVLIFEELGDKEENYASAAAAFG